MLKLNPRRLLGVGIAALLTATAGAGAASASEGGKPVSVRILTPRPGDNAGIGGAAWIVHLAVRYPSLRTAGFVAPQLTGPAAHNNTAPFPGTFSPGRDERLPGLVVLDSGTTAFSGPGTNLANLFNMTSVGDRSSRSAQVLDDWIVGAPLFGVNAESTLSVAVVADLNHDGVLNDAPNVVPDADHNGRVDARDLRALHLASSVRSVRFRINGDKV